MALYYEVRPIKTLSLFRGCRIVLSSGFIQKCNKDRELPGFSKVIENELGDWIEVKVSDLLNELDEFVNEIQKLKTARYSLLPEGETIGLGRLTGGVIVDGKVGIIINSENECTIFFGLKSKDPYIFDEKIDLRNLPFIETETYGRILIQKEKEKPFNEVVQFVKLRNKLKKLDPDTLVKVVCG